MSERRIETRVEQEPIGEHASDQRTRYLLLLSLELDADPLTVRDSLREALGTSVAFVEQIKDGTNEFQLAIDTGHVTLAEYQVITAACSEVVDPFLVWRTFRVQE